MRGVAEHERQIEDVELGDERPHRPDTDACHLQRAELRLLDHLLFAAELHRRIHLDAEPAGARGFELLAHAHDRLDRRIAERVHVGRLEDGFLLSECRYPGGSDAERRAGTEAQHRATIHDVLPGRALSLSLQVVLILYDSGCGRKRQNNMQRVLVTGAAGGIGSRLRKLLKGVYPEIRWSDLKLPSDLARGRAVRARRPFQHGRGGKDRRRHAGDRAHGRLLGRGTVGDDPQRQYRRLLQPVRGCAPRQGRARRVRLVEPRRRLLPASAPDRRR